MHRRLLALLFFVACTLAVGCDSVPRYLSDDNQLLPEPTGDGLVARPSSPIPDAPMPVGFVMVEGKSRAYSVAGGGRFVEHYYQGRAPKADTLRFYHQQLPQHGWRYISEQNQGGNITSYYAKGSENLRLSLSGDSVTTLIISIHNRQGVAPSKQRAAPRSAAP